MDVIATMRFLTIVALAGAVLTAPASAQDARQPSAVQRAQFEARLQETRDRLGLTPEQEETVHPILVNSLEGSARILQRYGFDGETRPDLSLRDRRKLRVELEALREQTDEALSTVLTPEQLTRYERIREERQDELRSRYRSGK